MMLKLFKNYNSFIIKSFFFIILIAILKIPLNELSDLLSWYINYNNASFSRDKAFQVDIDFILNFLELKKVFCALSADFLSSKYIKPGDYGSITILKSIGCLSESIEKLQDCKSDNFP